MKYASDTFAITASYEEQLRNRATLLQKQTNTRKALQHVFITTYGVAQNAYSHIVQNDIKLDDLFR